MLIIVAHVLLSSNKTCHPPLAAALYILGEDKIEKLKKMDIDVHLF